MNHNCPIWDVPVADFQIAGSFFQYECPRAGGKYIWKFHFPQPMERVHKAKLSTWISEQNRFGVVPVVDDIVLATTKILPRLSVAERADRLLLFVEEEAKTISGTVFVGSQAVNMPQEIKAIGQRNFLKAMCRSECAEQGDLATLFQFLVKQLSLECEHGQSLDVDRGTRFALTFQGCARLAELAVANQTSSQAFVAMWFDPSMDELWKNGIGPGIRDAGYKPQRIDKKDHNNKICDEIIAEIRKSRFVVADFTSEPDKPRGGVYYEAGFAQGMNIPVIWCCHEDLLSKVHFDTRQYAHIAWKNPEELRDRLNKRIQATIGQGPVLHQKQGTT